MSKDKEINESTLQKICGHSSPLSESLNIPFVVYKIQMKDQQASQWVDLPVLRGNLESAIERKNELNELIDDDGVELRVVEVVAAIISERVID